MASKDEAEFFSKIKDIISRGWIDLPQEVGFQGTGAPGLFLEQLVGISANNRDGPDSGVWELKYHGGSSPLTFFHLTPQPNRIMHDLVRTYGWEDAKGRTSFRHTIWGKSPRGFTVRSGESPEGGSVGECLIVENDDPLPDGRFPYWSNDALMSAFVYKLRRLAVVHGAKRNGKVRYEKAYLHSEPKISLFVQQVIDGTIAVDFDARTNETGNGLRDHGTKFRVKIEDLAKIYGTSVILE